MQASQRFWKEFIARRTANFSLCPGRQGELFSRAEDWIEALKNDGITSGCGAGIYCPENSVTRDQMAVFLVRTFNLP